jgi:DNA-binding XRE family transcriptional regulator
MATQSHQEPCWFLVFHWISLVGLFNQSPSDGNERIRYVYAGYVYAVEVNVVYPKLSRSGTQKPGKCIGTMARRPGDNSGKVFGKRVRALRLKLGNLSQEDLADKAQLHRTFLGRVERGETNITLSNILRIIGVLGVTLSEFFEGFEETLDEEQTHSS